MKFLPLIYANLTCNKLRTAFTFLAIVFALLLFGVLSAVNNAFTASAVTTGAERLRMIHKVSVVESLPVHYYDRIAATQGVQSATYVHWFGGVYQDPGNFFPQLAVSETYFDVYGEYILAPVELDRWRATRTGAVVGRALADRFDWRIGDRIPLHSPIYEQDDGSDVMEFTLEAIFVGKDDGVDESQMFFHYKYLEESSADARGNVRWFVVATDQNVEPAAVARRLDAEFANSSAETKTSTERAFLQSFANQIGNTALIVTSVVGVTFFVILMVVGNAIAQSVRERLSELAVLKALGFTDALVVGLVFGECVVLCFSAGILGLAIAGFVVQAGVPTLGMTGVFRIALGDVAMGVTWIAALACASGLAPAISVLRMRVAVGLRRV